MPKPALHLSDGDIRTALINYLRLLGYEVDHNSIRIYGYGEQDKLALELREFQGHVVIKTG